MPENIVKTAAADGAGDFVEQVSCELPLQVIAGLLGVPQDERAKLFRWTNEMTGNEDPEFADVDGRASSMELLAYAMQMAAIKAENPGEDIVTALINADIAGEKLSDDEFAFFVLMLAVAGSETTRNSITHGMIAFLDNPDQWELYKRQRPKTAADEIDALGDAGHRIPAHCDQRHRVGGVPIKAGQRVVMFYRSANFDDEVFEDPHTFNILRSQSARRLRRYRRALLPGGQSGADDDRPDVQRHRRPYAGSRRSEPQSGFGQAGSMASNTGRSTTPVPPRPDIGAPGRRISGGLHSVLSSRR